MGLGKSLVSIVLGLSASFGALAPVYSAENPPTPPDVEVPTKDNEVERYLLETKDKDGQTYYDKFLDKMHRDAPDKKDSEFLQYLKSSGLEDKIKSTDSFKKWDNEDFKFENPVPDFNPKNPASPAEPATQPTPAPVPKPEPLPQPPVAPEQVPAPTPVPVPKPAPGPVQVPQNPVPATKPAPVPPVIPQQPIPQPATAPVVTPAPQPAPITAPAPVVQNPVPDFNPAPPQDKSSFFAGAYAAGYEGENKTTSSSYAGVSASAGLENKLGKTHKITAQGVVSQDKYTRIDGAELRDNANAVGAGYENQRFAIGVSAGGSENNEKDPAVITSSTNPPLTTKTTTDSETKITDKFAGARALVCLNSSKSQNPKESFPRILFSMFNRTETTQNDTNGQTDVINSIDPAGDYTVFFANSVKVKEYLQGFDFEASNSFFPKQWDADEFVNYGVIGRMTKDKFSGPSLDRKIDELALGLVFSGQFNRHSSVFGGENVFIDGQPLLQNDGLFLVYEFALGAEQTKDSQTTNDNKLSMFGFGDLGFYNPAFSVLAGGNSRDKRSGMGEAAMLFNLGKNNDIGDNAVSISAFKSFRDYLRFVNRVSAGFGNSYGQLAGLEEDARLDNAVNRLADFNNYAGAVIASLSNDDTASVAGAKAYLFIPVDQTLMLRADGGYQETDFKGAGNYAKRKAGGGLSAVTSSGNALGFRIDSITDSRKIDPVTVIGVSLSYNFNEGKP